MQDLLNYAAEIASKNPNLKSKINSLLQDCKEYIAEGKPSWAEIEICWNDISTLETYTNSTDPLR